MSDIFISSTDPALQPVRAQVVAHLVAAGHAVSEAPSDAHAGTRERLIDACDLFLAILPPEGVELPTRHEDDNSSPLLDEFKYAGSILRDCLVYAADIERIPSLKRLTPPPKTIVDPPRIPLLNDPPEPSRPNTLSVSYWKQMMRALGGADTPEEQYQKAMDNYDSKRSEKRQLRSMVKQWQGTEKARRQEVANEAHRRELDRYNAQKAAADELERERENYLYHRFGLADELLRLLDDDLAALARHGYLPGTKHRGTLLRRWAQATASLQVDIEEVIDARRRRLAPSPAEVLLPDFYALRWHEEARQSAKAVAEEAAEIARAFEFPEVRAEINPYARLGIEWNTKTYEVIADELWQWANAAEDSVRRIGQWIEDKVKEEEKKKRFGPSPDIRQSLEHYDALEERVDGWLKRIGALGKFLQDSSFGKCLLLTGRSGSGKSHFVARLLEQHGGSMGELTPYYLYLPPCSVPADDSDPPSMEEILLQGARFAGTADTIAPRWHSFAEFADFVAQMPNAKLVIVLDNLDVWLARRGLKLNDLRDFIELHTHLHHLSWIMCVREHQLHRVSYDLVNTFWERYAPIYERTTNGWRELELLNKNAEVWRAVVLSELGAMESDTLDEIIKELSEQTRQLIEMPFIARIFAWFIQAGRPVPELRNLNYIEFVEEYWKRRTLRLLREGGSQGRLATPEDPGMKEGLYWRAIFLIAGLVAEQAKTKLGAGDLPERLRQADVEPAMGLSESAESIVEALVDTALLVPSGKPADIGRSGHQVSLGGFPPLWYWQIGEYLLEALRNAKMPLRLSAVEIARKVGAHFNLDELRDLCFELGLEFENLEGEGRAGKARELVALQLRDNNLDVLLDVVRRERPRVHWPPLTRGSEEAEVDTWLRYRFEERWSDDDRRDLLPEVLEFFLLLLDRDQDASRKRALVNILSGSIRQFPLYQPQVWLAAAKAGGMFQFALGEWLKKNGNHKHVAEMGLHQFLYFLKYAAAGDGMGTGLTCVSRLMLMRPFYHVIPRDEYLRGALSAMWAAGDPYDAARSLAYLDGIEPHLDETSWKNNSTDLAHWSYGELEKMATRLGPGVGRDEPFARAHELMLTFLDEVARLRDLPGEQEKLWNRHWVRLVGVHCGRFAPRISLEELEWLAESGWLSLAEKPGTIDRTVESQLTVSCGKWYRDKAKDQGKERYRTSAEAWAQPELSPGRKRVAFYMCKHTVASEGPGADETVDEELWQIVKQLRKDENGIIRKIFETKAMKAWLEKQER